MALCSEIKPENHYLANSHANSSARYASAAINNLNILHAYE